MHHSPSRFFFSLVVLVGLSLVLISMTTGRISGQTNQTEATVTNTSQAPPRTEPSPTAPPVVGTSLMTVIKTALQLLWKYRWELLVLALLLGLLSAIQLWMVRKYGPKDTTGNGITIGRAKTFDNRSLTLRIERLSASLRELKTISQNVTANISSVQGVSSTESTRSVTVAVSADKAGGKTSVQSQEGDKGGKSDTAPGTKAAAEPTVAIAASDVLSDQLNLASQILNLETLFERSLTDRLIGNKARLQTVLGFQVSVTPPAGYQNCVAVAEIAVRVKKESLETGAGQPSDSRISLVALIPHEKSYNSQTISSSSKSIGGSAVASVVTLGFTKKGESRQVFIHRDSDTIAFERDPRSTPTIFSNDSSAIVFGWEFRPVLDRSTVAAGTRQMLAVIALPIEEKQEAGEVFLEVKTRSYWRRYNARKQTSNIRWLPMPLNVDGSRRNDSDVQVLRVPNTAEIQNALAPTISEIKWVNSGADRATVIVKGTNFFSGTKVLTGGKVHREEDKSLTLKSDQALEFETTIGSLVTGDSVLSGRFGPSFQLAVPVGTKQVVSLSIERAVIGSSPSNKNLYIMVDVKGVDKDGEYQDLTVEYIQKLPEPILFVGSEPVPMPYDYYDIDPDTSPGGDAESARAAEQAAVDAASLGRVKTESAKADEVTPGSPATEADGPTATPYSSAQSSTKYIQVCAWIPKTLATSPTVAFRIPFCGFEYQASLPFNYSEPSVTRIGGDTQNLLLRITHPLASKRKVSVELDRVYEEGGDELKRITDSDFRFKVSTSIATQHNYLVLIIEAPEPGEPPDRYLLPIPAEEKPKPKTMIELGIKPPQVKQDGLGPVEWSGVALDEIKSATLFATAKPDAASKGAGVPAQFTVYEGGKKIEVYFSENSTKNRGKAEVVFETVTGEKLRAPLFIGKDELSGLTG